jgi:hypothetical protein
MLSKHAAEAKALAAQQRTANLRQPQLNVTSSQTLSPSPGSSARGTTPSPVPMAIAAVITLAPELQCNRVPLQLDPEGSRRTKCFRNTPLATAPKPR